MIGKRKCRNRKLNKYPCDAYLHEALYFLRKWMVDEAYSSVCKAILESDDGVINDEEIKFLEEIYLRKQIKTIEAARR